MKEPIINLARAGLTINMYHIRHLFYILHINQPQCWIAMNQTLDAWFDNKSTLNLGGENLKPSTKVGSGGVTIDLWNSDELLLEQIMLHFSSWVRNGINLLWVIFSYTASSLTCHRWWHYLQLNWSRCEDRVQQHCEGQSHTFMVILMSQWCNVFVLFSQVIKIEAEVQILCIFNNLVKINPLKILPLLLMLDLNSH